MANFPAPNNIISNSSVGIPDQSVPFIDVKTGAVSRAWWLYLSTMYERAGGATGSTINQLTNIAYRPNPEFLDEFSHEEPMLFLAQNNGNSQVVTSPASDDGFCYADDPVDAMQEALSISNPLASNSQIGAYFQSQLNGTSLTTNVTVNLTSLSLPAGNWDVSGTVAFVPAGTTVLTQEVCAITTTSATLGALGSISSLFLTAQSGAGSILSTPVLRLSLSATTTVFIVASATFTVSTCTANGFIRATRTNL